MKAYSVKYRQPGQLFWRRVKNVVGDGVENGFRFFCMDDDRILYVSLSAEVLFSADRQKVILAKMSSESGQQIARKA